MTIGDKIDNLIVLTETTNARIAKELHIDPSLVSRWRNGTRNPQGNEPLLENLAALLAGRIIEPYQVRLARYLIERDSGLSVQKGNLQQVIFQWLKRDELTMDTLLRYTQKESVISEGAKAKKLAAGLGENTCFTGETGLRQSLDRLMQHWGSHASRDGELLFYCGEEPRWIEIVVRHVTPYLMQHPELTKQFRHIRLIVPETIGPQEMGWSVNLMAPFYHAGLFQIYGLERSHRDVFKHFVAVIRGVGAVTSSSYFGSDPVAVVHTEENYVQQLYKSLSELAANSTPLLKRRDRTSFQEYMSNRHEFLLQPEDGAYMGNMLLTSVMPMELLHELVCIFIGTLGNMEKTTQFAQRNIDTMDHFLKRHSLLYCMPLYEPEDVEAGAIIVPCLPRFYGNRPLVDCRRYRAVLRNLLDMMERYENFKFQMIAEIPHNYCASVKPGNGLFVSTNEPSPTEYYTTKPILLQAQHHNIMTRYWALPAGHRQRGYNMDKLREHIQKLDDYLAARDT